MPSDEDESVRLTTEVYMAMRDHLHFRPLLPVPFLPNALIMKVEKYCFGVRFF